MTVQTYSFQAEVAQLLHLVTHSLYSNPDIFLRELISNASDAADKLRFEALNTPALYEDQPTLDVRVSWDTAAKTITIADSGIGMSEQEAIEHLGTIAKSGTKDFVNRLTGDQKADAQLIGQKRKIVSLELIGIQLNIGKPITLKPAARATAIQQDIARKVIAVDELLDGKHTALAGLNKAHRALKVTVSGHNASIGPHAVETLGSQSLKLRSKLAVRIVPNHNTARRA